MNNKYEIIFILIILSISLTGCFLFPSRGDTTEWTVMVYLDADNDLESAGIDDINEMEMIGSTTDVNIVVQVDRIPDYDISNSDWTNTRRYYITQDFDPYQISSDLKSDLGELNMGDPQTLIDFASWAITTYPAKKYLLVIWNHGGGFRSPAYTAKDIAWDDTSGGDRITMPELEYALLAISTQMGKNIDIVGMDACLMAMTEVAYQIKGNADIMVASEETEPGDGWPYDTILAQLVANPTISSTQLADTIVSRYIYSYTSSDNVTQSAINLSYMGTLASQLSNLALAIMSDTLTPKNNYIIAAYNSQYYSQWLYTSEKEFIDLYDFCDKLLVYSNSSNVKNIVLSIQQILNSAIINSDYNGVSVSGSKGLSIYFPYYSGYINIKYSDTNFAQDTQWDEMLLFLGL